MQYLLNGNELQNALNTIASSIIIYKGKKESSIGRRVSKKNYSHNNIRISNGLKESLIEDLSIRHSHRFLFNHDYNHSIISDYEKEFVLENSSKYIKQNISVREIAQQILCDIDFVISLDLLEKKIRFLTKYIVSLSRVKAYDKLRNKIDQRINIKHVKSNLNYNDEEEIVLKLKSKNLISNTYSKNLHNGSKNNY